MYSDARVLSLVQKQHGQRGVRELQGNSLRKALYILQQHLVSVCLLDSLCIRCWIMFVCGIVKTASCVGDAVHLGQLIA